jgi:TPR repeat protein
MKLTNQILCLLFVLQCLLWSTQFATAQTVNERIAATKAEREAKKIEREKKAAAAKAEREKKAEAKKLEDEAKKAAKEAKAKREKAEAEKKRKEELAKQREAEKNKTPEQKKAEEKAAKELANARLLFNEYVKKAEKDDPEALFELAVCYQYGIFVTRDFKESFRLYSKASELGNANAQVELGNIYLTTVNIQTLTIDNKNYILPNPIEAIKLYEKAAAQNNPVAQYNIAYTSLYNMVGGKAVSVKDSKSDLKRAFEYAKKADDQDYIPGTFLLGACYLDGKGTKQNKTEGFKLIKKAADGNLKAAQLILGQCYELGNGVKRDEAEAEKYYKLANENVNDPFLGNNSQSKLSSIQNKLKTPSRPPSRTTTTTTRDRTKSLLNFNKTETKNK